MTGKPGQVKAAVTLRGRAEARLKAAAAPVREADRQRLIHELQVHQIELELQNEELQATQVELANQLTKYVELYDFAPTGYFTLDRTGTIRGLNIAGAELLGGERADLVGQRFGQFITAHFRPAFNAFLAQAYASGIKTVCESPLLRPANALQWVGIEAGLVGAGQECRLAVMDITARKRAEVERTQMIEQLHAANEVEKRRIGEALQADLCQRLVGIEAAAVTVAKTLKRQARPESSLAQSIAGEIRESLQEARDFSLLLQPVSLLEQGLVAALDQLLRQSQARHEVRCLFRSEDLPPLPAADATHLFRIAQAALEYAVRHAQAQQIDVGLSTTDRDITIIITDDGIEGPARSTTASSFGRQAMRYRSDLLGAALNIESNPGRGTTVTCRYPMAKIKTDRSNISAKHDHLQKNA